jgi:DNA polymerase elongation subunit (family B)
MNEESDIVFQIIDWYTDNFSKRDVITSTGVGYESDENEEDDQTDSENEYNSEEDYFEPDDRHIVHDDTNYKIFIFGKDQHDKTYCLEVNEFTPYFFVKLPDYCTEYHKKIFEKWVRDKMWPKYRECLIRTTLMEKHRFRNFDNFKKYKMVRLVFRNTQSMRNAIDLFQNKEVVSTTNKIRRTPKKLAIPGINNNPVYYDLFENMIDPLLKFIHHRDLKPVGWIRIPKEKYQVKPNEESPSYCNINISAKWNDIKPYDNVNNSKIKIMAYDIECDSSHGDFPLPIKDYMKLARDIFSRYMKLDTIRQRLLGDKTPDNRKKAEEIKAIMEDQYSFAKEMIGYAFLNGSVEHEINKVYTKNNAKPSDKSIDFVAKKISKYLTLSTASNVNDRKKENTKNINKIIAQCNASLPPLEGDKTIQAALSFIRYGEEKPYKNYMITLGTCEKLSNAQTICVDNEAQLLLKFREIILKEDPEVITGYNTDGFDTPWLFKRATELGIEEDFSRVSRLKSYSSTLKEKQVKGPTGELIKKEYVDIPGRIQMDIMPLVQKGFSLESYKLDDVSAEFINGKVKELTYNVETNETKIKTESLRGLNERNYVIFSETDGYFDNRYNNGEKFEIYGFDFKDNSFKVNAKIELNTSKKCSWCLGKDDTSPQDIFRLQKGSSSDRYIIAKYCMMDVILCIELLMKLELLTNTIGMANVCLTPMSWIIHRGQGVKILSLVAYFVRKKDYLIPHLYKDTFDREGYEGAVVLDPNPKIYLDDEPISVLDYGSLYPSSMRELNISHETIVNDAEYLGDEGGKLLEEMGVEYKDVSYDTFKTIFTASGSVKSKVKVGVKTCRYVQYRDGSKGIIPQILEYLVNARKTTRNKISYKSINTASGNIHIGLYDENKKTIKTEKDGIVKLDSEDIISCVDTYSKFEQKVLDALQLAFKITANSLYGQVGAKTSDLYYKELAASTTAVGRERLIIAKEYVEEPSNYPHKLKNGEIIYLKNKVIYGDTDSVFVKYQCLDDEGNLLKGRDARVKSIQLGIQTDKAIQATRLKEPQVLEYEKTFHPFILFSKKRYVGNLYELDPDKFSRKSMGIVLKRRDNAPIVKIIYGGIIDIIMKEQDIKSSITFLRKTLIKLIEGEFNLDTLIITKTLSSYYKDPERIGHKVLADRIAERDPGNKPQVNDRIPFIYIDTSKTNKSGKKLLDGDKIENPDYIKQNPTLKPNYEHYITNQIMKPVSQIYALALDQIPGWRGDITEYDRKYKDLLKSGISNNDCIKKIMEMKRKQAASLLFGDILRRLENNRVGNRDITQFFAAKK